MTAAWPAAARTTGDQPAIEPAAAGAPPAGPVIIGLGPIGLVWLLAGLLALVAGLVLATRRGRGTSGHTSLHPSTSTSHDRSGGAQK